MIIRGVAFRFIDTAGLRKTEDKIEQIGVERAKNKMQTAELVIYLIDLSGVATLQDWQNEIAETHSLRQSTAAPFILVGNKSELADENLLAEIARFSSEAVFISALQKDGIEKLIEEMFSLVEADNFLRGDTTITNARHFENLDLTRLALQSVRKALDERISGELLAYHLREALQKLGEITGEITNDEILGSIFSKFCIGK
jgi:tRNA modification GTPase